MPKRTLSSSKSGRDMMAKQCDAMIELRQFRYAVAAADHGSLRREAMALNI
jgi:hypothetical protein